MSGLRAMVGNLIGFGIAGIIQQGSTAIIFALLSLAELWGTPLFDLWSFTFFFENYWIFFGRWDQGVFPGDGLRAFVSNIIGMMVLGIVILRLRLWLDSQNRREASS